jgi:hypothetical protein
MNIWLSALWLGSKKSTVTRFPKGANDVRTAEFYGRVADDGRQRDLLGIVG